MPVGESHHVKPRINADSLIRGRGLSEYEGRAIISVRVYSTGADGIDRPSPKGISMAVDKLPTLAQALVNAEAKARELGLIDNAKAAGA
jgi:hypothetical protein